MQTILVTGGAGYIGSHTLIELLASKKYNVISLDNFSNSSSFTYERVKKISGADFKSYEIDLCNEQAVDKLFSSIGQVDCIIHFAAFKAVPESMAFPLKYYRNNLDSLVNLLAAATKFKVGKFIFSSSCSVYGNADKLPVTEETPIKPAESSYAHTKQVGEEMIRFFSFANPSVKFCILRYFNPVGAHMSGQNGELPINKPNNLVPIITQTAVGKNQLTVFGNDYNTRDGSCIRDYIHVSDIADAHVKAIEYLAGEKAAKPVSVFNLGTGNGVSVLEVIHSFEKVTGQKLKYQIGARRSGDVVAVYSDNSLVRKNLGWEPRYSLDDMMLSAWKWQQQLESENH